jgi:hypothetical protein
MGTLELHVYPEDSKVFLNGKQIQGTGGAFRLTLQADKTYEVRAEHEGYATIKKDIKVRPETTTEVLLQPDLLPDQRYVSP